MAARDHVRALLEGYSPHKRQRRWLLMMRAYVDDSGNGQAPVFLLAGFVAHGEQWEQFSAQWQDVLDGPPKLEYFKMHEAARLECQFKNWTESERDSRLWEFLTVIRRNVELCVKWIVPDDAYDSVIKDRVARGMDNPYFFSFFGIMMGLIQYQEEHGLDEPVDFVFDEQMEKSDLVQNGYADFVKFAPDRVKRLLGGRPIHRSDKQILPLQAADLVAWITRRYYDEKARGYDDDNWVRRSLSQIETVNYELTTEELKRLLGRMRQINQAEGKVFPYDLKPPRNPGRRGRR